MFDLPHLPAHAEPRLGRLDRATQPACKGCTPDTQATSAWTPSGPECQGYHFKAQQSGETVLLTVTREGDAGASIVTTVTWKSAAQGGTTFEFVKSEPAVVAAPKAAATLDKQQLCLSFGPNDSATDACLTKFVADGRAKPTCIEAKPIQ